MNYIELINRFWKMNKEECFTANETQLYFKLLDTCNSLGWKNPFNHSNGYICGELGISEPTFLRCRNKLKQVGLIDFVSGKVKRQKTVYTVLGLNNFTLKDTLKDTLNDTQSVTQNSVKPLDNIKHNTKLNKTKTNILSDAIAPEEKEPTKFWKSFVDIWFRRYDEVTGAKPTFNGASAKNLKSIIQRLEKLYYDKNSHEWEEVKALITFNKFLDNALKDDWLKSNFLLTNLSTQFDKIVNQPKDGKSNNNFGKNNSSSYVAANINSDSLVQELTEDLANGNIPGQY